LQTEIEEFLRKNSPRFFLASEVADAMQISKSSAQKQLKKLAERGTVMTKEGRYGFLADETLSSANLLREKAERLAELTGLPEQVIEGWIQEVRTRKRKSDLIASGKRST
jgi:Mn-dependent DtxR family transcriptional regulator